MSIVFSIAETPAFPSLTKVFKKHNVEDYYFRSVRKAITKLKSCRPNIIIADFTYGYGSNYAGVNVSNLDVLFYSVQKYSPSAKKIILVKRHEQQYVSKLAAIFTLDLILSYPINITELEKIIFEN